jgi:hypothetical protein
MLDRASRLAQPLLDMIPQATRATALVRVLGLIKIPLIFFVRPKVIALTLDRTEVCIPLTRRTKNHLGSMYFGALAIGADLAGGLLAMQLIRESGHNVALIFKDFKADFKRRPTGDVHFVCEEGAAIKCAVERAIVSRQRVNQLVRITAQLPGQASDVAAEFLLTLSLKVVES